MTSWDILPPDCDTLEQIARDTVAALPEAFRAEAASVAIRVTDLIPEHLSDDPAGDWDITGLYDGISVPLKQSGIIPEGPDTVWLFRLPILLEWAERGNVELSALVAHVTVHEFAHHFGWSDDDIAAIDEWWT